ncbi:MAG: sigma-70 family RNA polymerase sigma factor [Candidatus Binatia bacterium]
MVEASDQMLLAAAQGGDKDALEALLLSFQPRVYRFGMKMCGDPDDAKDILQETLLAMARGLHDFRGASSLSTWLYTIARSFCIKKRRRGRFAPAEQQSLDVALPEVGAQLPDPRPGPEETLAERQVEAVLARAIASLDPMYREVLVLRDIEGLTAPEVAEVLGISVDATKSRLHRARLAVRELVLPHLGIGSGVPVQGVPPACPDVLTLFSRHLEGEISPNLCAQMERHLQDCARCRGACDSLKRTLALCHNTPTPRVPESVQESVRASLRRLLVAEAGC